MRTLDGIGSDGRRAFMDHCLQPFDCPQVKISEDRPSNVGSTQDGFAEESSAEDGFVQINSAQVRSTEIRFTEDGFAQVGFAQVGSGEVRPVEIGIPEVDSAEVGSKEVGSDKICFSKISSTEICTVEIDSTEVGIVEVSIVEVSYEVRRLFFHPGIPAQYSSVKKIEMLLVSHTASFLCSALIIDDRKSTRKQKAEECQGFAKVEEVKKEESM